MAWHSRPLSPDDIEARRGLPTPRFRVGAPVRTLIGNIDGSIVKTEITGLVVWYCWHWKRGTWLYKLATQGRWRNRCYLEEQLVPVQVSA